MYSQTISMWKNWRYDLPAALVVFLVALPLCLGIALASGAPLFSGLISGFVGAVVVGSISKSPLSVSGPAAGLTIIVLNAIRDLPNYESFLLAVCIAGVFQMIFGFLRAGIIGDFIPVSVIKGMLAAIGLILILKQLPHAVGYDANYVGDDTFEEMSGSNTFYSIFEMFEDHFVIGAILISSISLAFLFWWDHVQPKQKNILRYIPGPLVVVAFGIIANMGFHQFAPNLEIESRHLVNIPITKSWVDFTSYFISPDFGMIANKKVWIVAITIALIASLETLLSIEAIDKLDPYKRISPTNHELFAQGAGNIASGMLGGLPVTSVIVRSSANAIAGGRTKMSTIMHGILLLICVLTIPALLNRIPLSALAAILIAVGYKLTKPSIFLKKYEKGWVKFIPFVVTIVAILLTDLLIGIVIGEIVGIFFVLIENYQSAIQFVSDNNNYLVRSKKDLFFIHKYELKKKLSKVPSGSAVLIDLRRITFIDLDNVEIINDFIASAKYRDIRVSVRKNEDVKSMHLIEYNEVAHEAL